jgi:uncharacterized protein with PIN domain
MPSATVTLHGDLNDFLRPRHGGAVTDGPVTRLEQRFEGHPAVKDLLEAVGVPHPEIAAITVNGAAAGFAHPMRDGDTVEAWPSAEAAGLELTTVRSLATARSTGPGDPELPAEPAFVVDGHLGRLAAYLRMLGFDTWYRNDADDDRLAAVSASEGRILLTRDRGLLKRGIVERGAWVRSDQPFEQLVEVVRRFGLAGCWQPFGRCIRCNHALVEASRAEVLDRLEPLTRIHYDDFRRCPGCEAVYWKGSHHARMERLIDRVRAAAGP